MASVPPQSATASPAVSLLPLMATVFVVFLITGTALPALPIHIHDDLGFGTFTVGLVSGAQFVASLISRLWAGTFSDRSGPKHAVLTGLGMATFSGVLYLFSFALSGHPLLSVLILVAGRALLGGAESFVIVGAQSWSLALVGPGNAGKAIGWIGTSIYVALAVGAPLGSLLFGLWGFVATGLITLAIPLATMLVVVPMRPLRPPPRDKIGMLAVAKTVWLPGAGMAFASLGYGAMIAFSVLYFSQRGWQPAWLSFSAFAVAFVLVRTVFGWVPDRMGGAKTAMAFATIQSFGMAVIWLAPSAPIGVMGAVITGIGYSLVYPGLGLEAVRRAPAGTQGLAMGVYTAFLDIALGILTPLLGLLAGVAGLGSAFLVGAVLALMTVPIAAYLKTATQSNEHRTLPNDAAVSEA